MKNFLLPLLGLFTARSSHAFVHRAVPTATIGRSSCTDTTCLALRASPSSSSDEHCDHDDASSVAVGRRHAFRQAAAFVASSYGISQGLGLQQSQPVYAEAPKKVLVLGGTGFVGSRVVQKLKDMGVEVMATSRDGRDGTIAFDVASSEQDIADRIKQLASGYDAVVSCIGAIGTPDDNVVNSGTGFAAMGAKAAGVTKFVYITVAPEVKEFAKDIDFLKGYMEGKTFSRDAVLSSFRSVDGAVLIEPTFIYGGGSFELNPPRVAGFYGQFIEGLLSSSPIRSVERIMSPGIIKIALEPPVSVDSVADAAVAGALGLLPPSENILDSYDKIQQASKLV